MHIYRRGKYRDHGVDHLVNTEKMPLISWDEDERSVKLTKTSKSRGGSTYRYTVELTGSELAQLVETALVGVAHNDRHRKAEARAKAAYVRSMLADEE